MKWSRCNGIYVALVFPVAGAGLSPTRRSRIHQRRTSMRTSVWSLLMGVALFTALNCNADVKADEQIMAPTGWLAAAVSAHGVHVAVLAMKGSRNVVLIDGVEGPKFDQLIE